MVQVPVIDELGAHVSGAGGVRNAPERAAGRVLGATFEQLASIIERIPAPLQDRLGVCFDTCHVWAAGYDLRTAYDDVMRRFDDVIGLETPRDDDALAADRMNLARLRSYRGGS